MMEEWGIYTFSIWCSGKIREKITRFFAQIEIVSLKVHHVEKMTFLFWIIFFTPYFKKDGLFQTFFSSNIFSFRKMKCAWYNDDEFLSFLEQEHLFRKLLRKLDLALMKNGKKIFSRSLMYLGLCNTNLMKFMDEIEIIF